MDNTLARGQLMLPLLATLDDLGGEASASDVIASLSDRLKVPESVRDAYAAVDCGKWGTRQRCPWRQTVHWVRMDAVAAGYIERREHGVWTLSDLGRRLLPEARPGIILTVYETPSGQVVWADAMSAAGALSDASLNLVFTSPPYPILAGRSYGTFSEGEIVELIVRCAREWHRSLAADGSLVLNFKDVWLPKQATGGAVRSLYQEKLAIALCEDVGFHFADRFIWKNPSHLPDNPWITVRKVRTNCDFENVLWFGKTPNPKADNQRVLVDAAPSTIATYARKAMRGLKGTIGPSGHNHEFSSQILAQDAGMGFKVIPRNVLEISNANTHRDLTARLESAGLGKHDAMMPLALAEFFVNFLTEKDDTVYDPFFGSGTTGLAAHRTGRRFIGSDRSLAHLLGSALRFEAPAFAAAHT